MFGLYLRGGFTVKTSPSKQIHSVTTRTPRGVVTRKIGIIVVNEDLNCYAEVSATIMIDFMPKIGATFVHFIVLFNTRITLEEN